MLLAFHAQRSVDFRGKKKGLIIQHIHCGFLMMGSSSRILGFEGRAAKFNVLLDVST